MILARHQTLLSCKRSLNSLSVLNRLLFYVVHIIVHVVQHLSHSIQVALLLELEHFVLRLPLLNFFLIDPMLVNILEKLTLFHSFQSLEIHLSDVALAVLVQTTTSDVSEGV